MWTAHDGDGTAAGQGHGGTRPGGQLGLPGTWDTAHDEALAAVRLAMAELHAYDPDESAGHEDGIDRALGALERAHLALLRMGQ